MIHTKSCCSISTNQIHLYGDELWNYLRIKELAIFKTYSTTSSRIMKMMRRKNIFRSWPLSKALRKENTRAILRTDLIIGWPTETRQERIKSLHFAGSHFDEIAAYTIELHPDRPA